MGEKVTMVLKVDLQCRRCYKKVKQVLCKFPQIQDQIYDEKANTVTIKVVCCDPEKLMGKIRCKGGYSIKCIEIKPPPKSDKDKPGKTEPKPTDTPEPAKPPEKQASPTVLALFPGGFCCKDCYHGHHEGPCYFGGPPPPPYYWPYGRPVYVNWGCGGGGSTYCYCFEENPQCSVM
ncbi:hypothetical protein E1A91_D05G190700v1 [Gossypium mustelinum]|uniref:HMA domain-containing protein n=1 Tax=Gossypium mustelinum TaxID=34275 RepID=A0A5D2UWW7_GOSMU|nr:hypothetical protein E1A91_D05G190700v1 [Gossypium mustelinum]